MEILLSGSDWKFKGFVPHTATIQKVFKPEYDKSSWPKATVPGNVQLDLLALEAIDDPYIDFNSRNCEWVPLRQWAYAKKFSVPEDFNNRHINLRFEGIDYSSDIYLNGEHLGRNVNLFIPIEFNITDKIKYDCENSLVVVIDPAPDEQAQIGWTSKTKTVKPRMPYGWDFGTRCIPIGIWQDVKLVVTGDARISDCWADTSLNDDFTKGSITFRTDLQAIQEIETELKIEVSKDGAKIACSVSRHVVQEGLYTSDTVIQIDKPALWWPNGSGDHHIYTATVKLVDLHGNTLDERNFNFGFKQVRLISNPDLPEGLLPWSFEVNGKRTYIKGWNWVPVDHMYGGDFTSKYERLVRLAKEAHVNLLRVWGGGILEKEIFYDLCDRHGIMVWQEFPMSSSGIDDCPPCDPEFVDLLRSTGESMVRQRRNHVSHTVWCGGNELTWRGCEDTAMAAEHEICSRLDPQKTFIPTSPMQTKQHDEPLEVETHGHWQFLGPVDHYKIYNALRTAFHSEFGAEGCTNFENVPRFIHDVKLWPPVKTENEIWCHKGDWWANYPKLLELFGEMDDVKTYFRLSQFVQWEGLRYIVESGRRRKHACGGTIPWQFNEPWPNLSCTNSVDFYTVPKQAYYAVQNAYEPLLVSAKYEKIGWQPGEQFTADVVVTNSKEAAHGFVEYAIGDLYGHSLASGNIEVEIPGNGSLFTGSVQWTIPDGFEQVFLLYLRIVNGQKEKLVENIYFFSSAKEPIFAALQHPPQTKLKVIGSEQLQEGTETELSIHLLNEGSAYALFVRAIPEDNRTDVYFKSNYAVIAPGAKADIRASLVKPVSKFSITGWNTGMETIP